MEEMEQLNFTDYEMKSSHWVVVTHVIDPKNFYVRPIRYSNFIECIERTYPKDKPHSLNTLDLVLFNLDWMNPIPKFARGQVCFIRNANDVITCDIVGLDYGIFVKDVPLCHIWRMNETYRNLPPLAIKCQLLFCFPKNGKKAFDQDAIEAFKHFVGKEKAKIIIESKTPDKLVVEMYNSGTDDISTLLAATNYTQLFNVTMQNTLRRNRASHNALMHNALMQNAQIQHAQMQNAQMQNAQMQNAQMQNAQIHNVQIHSPPIQIAQIQNAQFHIAQIQRAQVHRAQIHNALIQNAQGFNTHCVIHHAPIPNDMNQRLSYNFRQYEVGQTILVKVLSGDIYNTFYVGEVRDFKTYKHELENFAHFASTAPPVKRLPCDLIPGTPVFVKENEGVYKRGIVKEATVPFLVVNLHLVDIGINYHAHIYHMRQMVRECIEMPPISIFCRANDTQMKPNSRSSKAIQPGNEFMITFEKVGNEYNIPHTVIISPKGKKSDARHSRHRH